MATSLGTVADILRCAVCLEFLRPPIKLCEEGHCICGGCLDSLAVKRCPTCTKPISNAKRAVALEQVLEGIKDKLKVECCYKSRGCDYVLPENDMDFHMLECRQRTYRCPGKTFCKWDCDWQGRFSEILDHFSRTHPYNSSMEYKGNVHLKINFQRDFNDLHVISFFSGKHIFLYTHRVDVAAQKAYWIFQYVGPKKQAKYYEYEFEVKDGDVRKFKVNEYCEGDTADLDEIFKKEKCVTMSFNTIKNYVDVNGELHSKYRIMKVKPPEKEK